MSSTVIHTYNWSVLDKVECIIDDDGNVIAQSGKTAKILHRGALVFPDGTHVKRIRLNPDLVAAGLSVVYEGTYENIVFVDTAFNRSVILDGQIGVGEYGEADGEYVDPQAQVVVIKPPEGPRKPVAPRKKKTTKKRA